MRKKALYKKIREYLKRGRAVSRTLAQTFRKVNQMIIGWINYFRIGRMKKIHESIWEMAKT